MLLSSAIEKIERSAMRVRSEDDDLLPQERVSIAMWSCINAEESERIISRFERGEMTNSEYCSSVIWLIDRFLIEESRRRVLDAISDAYEES